MNIRTINLKKIGVGIAAAAIPTGLAAAALAPAAGANPLTPAVHAQAPNAPKAVQLALYSQGFHLHNNTSYAGMTCSGSGVTMSSTN